MPNAMNVHHCRYHKIIKWALGYTSVSQMCSAQRALKYYGISEPPAENGLTYDTAIDIAIISELSVCDSLSSAELKRRIEKTLDRSIFPKTYYNHSKMLVSDNLLNRDDSAGIGKLVFYSLTEEAKKRKPLRLLRTDPDYRLTKHMYYHLLFQGIIKNNRNRISIQDFINRSSIYGQTLRVALTLLVDSGLLLSPEASDHKRYLLADPALHNLLRDIVDFRKTIHQNEGKSERRQIIEESEMVNAKNKTNSRIVAINEIKKKHANTLRDYSFLSDVIQILCPLLFPELPYRELMSL
jgi:hypothetical protein